MREPLYRRLNILSRKGFVEVVQSQLVIQIVMKAGAEVAGATRQEMHSSVSRLIMRNILRVGQQIRFSLLGPDPMVTRHNRCQFGIGDLAQRREREGFSGIHQLFSPPTAGRSRVVSPAAFRPRIWVTTFAVWTFFACISATAARISSVLPPEVPT